MDKAKTENKDSKEKFLPLDIDYRINVHVKGHGLASGSPLVFSVPVGFGYKTITWLALCAAQQYSEVVYPKGHYLPHSVSIKGKGYYMLDTGEGGVQTRQESDIQDVRYIPTR